MEEREQFGEFFRLCRAAGEHFAREWQDADEWEKAGRLEREKKAIMGSAEEVSFYKEEIRDFLAQDPRRERTLCPPWYESTADGIFAELYGLAGLDPWAYDRTEEYKNSSSAKLIGDRLYCLIDGRSVLQPQRISKERREQLKRALLLATPEERLEAGFHEVYLHNGIRITIYSGERTKPGQDVMIFRKYILRELTFEKLAALGTIPPEAVELFKTMVKIGFNVLFAGQVRSGKTTFLQVWQRYEDKTLEGLAIATDPETPWHEIMPEAPIVQLTADGGELAALYKSLLRGDSDYILLEEMRDASAFKLALDITSAGTLRSKATVHAGDCRDIPYRMAADITARYGGSFRGVVAQVFRNFHYVLEFYQLPESRDKKRLRGISEYRYDAEKDAVSIHRICRYDELQGRWLWKCDVGWDKRELASAAPADFERFENMLKILEKRDPLPGQTVIYPHYYRSEAQGL